MHHICFSETPTHGPEQGSHREAACSLQAPLLRDLQSGLVPAGAAQSPAPSAALQMTCSRILSPSGTKMNLSRIFLQSYSNEKCKRVLLCFVAAFWVSWFVLSLRSNYEVLCSFSLFNEDLMEETRHALPSPPRVMNMCVSPPISRYSINIYTHTCSWLWVQWHRQ